MSILSKEDEQLAISIARLSVQSYITHSLFTISDDLKRNPTFNQRFGVFITLKQYGQLRGCIGCLESEDPLYDTLAKTAIKSATQDYRFSPISPDELESITYECSILSKPTTIQHYNEIVIGTHGIIVKKYNKSAVYLPKVASEQGWDLDTTLTQLCLKAGLTADDWKSDCQFEVFTAQEF